MPRFLQILRAVVILVFCSFGVGQAAADAPRHAILIGNAGYTAPLDLPNPVNDVRAMGGVLTELGFEVQSLENGTKAQMREHLRTAIADIPKDALVVFYYAGHAVQKDGVNWLLPVDFSISKDAQIEPIALGIDEVIAEIDAVENVTKILILDACRDYPLGDADEALGNGLAKVISRGETLIAYATLSGEVARDGAGPNSPYTGALVSALDIRGMELYDVFRTARYQVRTATRGVQLPWVSGSLKSKVILNPDDETPSEEEIQLASLDPIEAVHWSAISRSNSPYDFELFASAHRNSALRTLAVQRQEDLREAEAQRVPIIEVADEHPVGAPFKVTACDRWVSDPLDPKRVADGVPWGVVNTRNAIRSCSIALAENPDNPRIAFLLGRALDISENFEYARLFYEQAAEKGYGVASRNLGYMYRNARGVPANDELAARYYFEAAMDGVIDARKALAKLYEEGWGVEQSYVEMLRWLELSAGDNYPNSLDHLGNLYRTGEYVDQNYDTALELYERGAAVGYGNAIANMARMYRDGLGVEEDRARALALYQDATNRGNAFAPYHLARMILKPKGDEVRDAARAQALLELSAERGYAWALWQLARSWKAGDFGAPNLENAAFYLWAAAEAGRSMRNKGGVQLVSDATNLLKEVEPLMPQSVRDQVEQRTQLWLKQNSLLNFSLIYPY